jgi:hypothetical protein
VRRAALGTLTASSVRSASSEPDTHED